MGKIVGIYCIENIVDGKKYIGQSVNIAGRKSNHFSKLRSDCDDSIVLQNAWNKYGEENFKFYIIDECATDVLDEKEKFWIKELHSHISEHGYNISWGGFDGLRGRKHTEELKKKMSNASKGKVMSEDARKKVSIARKGKPMSEETKKKISESSKGEKNKGYGIPLSEETKKKISIANTGKIVSEETRQKISEFGKGRVQSEETREKISEANIGRKFTDEHRKKLSEAKQNMSEETRKKISIARTGKPMSEETKKKISESEKGEKNYNFGKTMSDEQKEKLSLAKSGKKRPNSSSKYIGVGFNKAYSKWKVEFRYNRKTYFVGYFLDELEAALAYNFKILELAGENAKLNIIKEEDENE